jgi:iron complex outermembrane receptor protein
MHRSRITSRPESICIMTGPQSVLSVALLAAFAALATPLPAHAQANLSGESVQQRFSLPAQSLGQTINTLARQSNTTISVNSALVEGKTAPAIQGALSLQQALEQALAGSGLAAVNSGSAIVIVPAGQGAGQALPAVTIQSERESPDGAVPGYVARRSRSATKTDTALLEIPQSVSVIGRSEMEARGAQDVMDIVAQTPGIAVNTYGPDNRGWEYISLRGFSGITGNFRDSLAQTPFSIVYSITEPYFLDRVEVLRGPASIMFGQADAGGIINRVSKQANGERVREIEAQVGSFNRRQLAFDLGDSFGPQSDLSYRLVGVTLDSDDQDRYPNGQRINRKRQALSPSLRWAPNAATSLTVSAELLHNESGEDPYYAIAADRTLTRVKMGDPSFSRIKQDQKSIGYRFEHAFSDDWSLRQNLRYSEITLKRRAIWVDELQPDRHTYSRLARTWDDTLQRTMIDTQLLGHIRGNNISHTLLFGLDWSRSHGDERRFMGAAPDLDLLNPVYNQSIVTPTTSTSNYRQSTEQTGLYGQDQIRLFERWVLTLGGRQDFVRSVTDNRLTATSTTQSDSVFSGRAGLNYLFGGGWAAYAGYTQSFLPNSGVDANNDPLKPSHGKQIETGIKYQPENSRIFLAGALFDLTKTNVVTYDDLSGDTRQIGRQRSRGIELEAKAELLRGLNLTASLTKMKSKVLESADRTEAGKVPATIPQQMASLWLDYSMASGFGMGAGINYVGPRQNDEANTTVEGGYSLLGGMLKYETGPWLMRLNASNLLNKRYNTICYHGECYLGAERAITATVKYRF